MAAPHVYTLTGNLLCERTLEFSDWAAGRTQRALRDSFQVGGKGINVAKMLQRLGAPATALCFAGGATGAECEAWLGRQKFAYHAFPCSRPTRVGLVVRSPQQPETTFLGLDAVPDDAAVAACAAYLDRLPDGQILAVAGSIPGWAGKGFAPLRAALTRWQERGVLAADSYGPPLGWLVALPLALVKINAVELRTLFPTEPGAVAVSSLLSQARQRWPARRWVVTDGGGPLWFCDEGGALGSIMPPAVTEVSPTGSGDVLLACVLDFHFRRKRPLAEAIAQALPYAAANAAHPGVADFPLPKR